MQAQGSQVERTKKKGKELHVVEIVNFLEDRTAPFFYLDRQTKQAKTECCALLGLRKIGSDMY